MSREAVEQIVGRAVIDGEFRAHLLASPTDAARAYDLSAFERGLLRHIRAANLADFALALEERLNAPTGAGRRRASETTWRERRASA
jgi:hypothetical protein